MGRAPTSGGQPSCQRCLRANRICDGYDIPLRMEHHVGGGPQSLPRMRMVISNQPGYNHPPPVELDLRGFEEQMAFSHFFKTYRWANLWRPVMQLAEDPVQPAGKYAASLAMVYGHMASKYQASRLKCRSLTLLQSAMKVVQGTMQKGSRESLVSLIPVLAILNQYDFAVEDATGLLHHYGIQQILKSCGPASFTGERQLAIFRYAREALVRIHKTFPYLRNIMNSRLLTYRYFVLRIQLCQALVQKCRLFLEEEDWKAIPWSHSPKTTTDRLVDILVDIPSLTEKVTSQSKYFTPSARAELLIKIRSLRTSLVSWRWAWEDLYPNAAREVAIKPLVVDLGLSYVSQVMSTGIEFALPNQASEILTYNASMIKLVQLESMLYYENANLETPVSMPIERPRTKGMCDSKGEQQTSALVLPNQLSFMWQLVWEALRVLARLSRQFSVTEAKTFVSLSPIAILYCFLRGFGKQEVVVALIGYSFGLEEADKELFVHELVAAKRPKTSDSLSPVREQSCRFGLNQVQIGFLDEAENLFRMSSEDT
ncbi:hypothetical protein BX600DRAFT_537231 [Xylariales sp. PMI_506]|nr:hypothetical protein BX600DRAFT_537231 [Xylariales sp. PMI_506]